MGENQYSLVVVSNRLPVTFERDSAGVLTPAISPGGLVAAVAPALRGKNAAWVGWDGTFDGSENSLDVDGIALFPVALSQTLVKKHYEGFSNSTLWPLLHDIGAQVDFEESWWSAYCEVNQRCAEAVARVAAHHATVWIHDYQMMLVPSMVRSLRPDVTMGYFHHIPFPSPPQWDLLPHASEVVAGLYGADVCGFQRHSDTENFLAAAQAAPPASGLKIPKAKTYPISLDFADVSKAASSAVVKHKAKEFRKQWGSPTTVLLGVDRIDYTKGIPERLEAFESLLESGHISTEDVVFVQAGSPSRENVASYQALQTRLDSLVKRINEKFPSSQGRMPVVYWAKNLAREDMLALFVAADVMVVSPLRDGMNLVAKEFIACRGDNSGVLILSTGAGAADHLTQAVLCEPGNPEALHDAILTALAMDGEEAHTRMAAMRDYLAVHDVVAWASDILGDLASLPGK